MDLSVFDEAHNVHRKLVQNALTPYKEMINWAQKRKLTIGDFGCGEALLSTQISEYHTVYSFDHVAINDRVIATD